MYLSTDMKDIKGNRPYFTELEGVKKYGEVCFTYYFKELNSNDISKKITYAKLYKNFNWIIAMGVNFDDIHQYIVEINKRGKEMAVIFVVQFVILLIVIVAFCLGLLLFLERWHFKKLKVHMELEINEDPLTKICNRRYGTEELTKALNGFKKSNMNPAVMMFDIDRFKYVNDIYGHDVGDEVLKEVVNAVYQIVRSSDKLIRWGGDEFVGIFYGLKKKMHFTLERKY